ncbi:hypothetical protein V8B97DRAFT_1915851 [Scleroderma yunnanense]
MQDAVKECFKGSIANLSSLRNMGNLENHEWMMLFSQYIQMTVQKMEDIIRKMKESGDLQDMSAEVQTAFKTCHLKAHVIFKNNRAPPGGLHFYIVQNSVQRTRIQDQHQVVDEIILLTFKEYPAFVNMKAWLTTIKIPEHILKQSDLFKTFGFNQGPHLNKEKNMDDNNNNESNQSGDDNDKMKTTIHLTRRSKVMWGKILKISLLVTPGSGLLEYPSLMHAIYASLLAVPSLNTLQSSHIIDLSYWTPLPKKMPTTALIPLKWPDKIQVPHTTVSSFNLATELSYYIHNVTQAHQCKELQHAITMLEGMCISWQDMTGTVTRTERPAINPDMHHIFTQLSKATSINAYVQHLGTHMHEINLEKAESPSERLDIDFCGTSNVSMSKKNLNKFKLVILTADKASLLERQDRMSVRGKQPTCGPGEFHCW